jgi:magnesium transporter
MTAPKFAAALAREFIDRHPADAAHTLQRLEPDETAAALSGARPEAAAAVLGRLAPDAAGRVLVRLDRGRAQRAVAQLEAPVAARVLRRAGERLDTAALLAGLPAPRRRELESLMSYPPGSAGSLMDPAAPVFRADELVGGAIASLRESKRTGDLVVLVVDEDLTLQGVLPTVAVLLANPAAPLASLGVRPTPSIDAFADQEAVVQLIDTHKVSAMPVIDVHGRPVGVLRHHALASVAEEDAVANMQSMVGASREERALSPVTFAVRKRLLWLQINLATAFLAAAVVGLFEDTIAQFTALAVLLPVVAGQSGNTGAQALAVTMRGLTLHEIGLRQWARILAKESSVGLLNGVAVALVTMAGVYLWSGSAGLAAVIGLAMVISMTIAGVAGASVPLVLSATGQDPAQSSSIVLTTVTDVMGFFSFLALAQAFSNWL